MAKKWKWVRRPADGTQGTRRKRNRNKQGKTWDDLNGFKRINPRGWWLYLVAIAFVVAVAAGAILYGEQLLEFLKELNISLVISAVAVAAGALGLFWVIRNHRNVDARLITRALYWLTVLILLIFMGINVMPYYRAAFFIFQNVFGESGVLLPIGSVFSGVFGLLLWGILQTYEIYPIFLNHSRKMLQVVLRAADDAPKFQVKNTDDPTAVALKRWYNALPLVGIKSARTNRWRAYFIDLIICLAVYPPIDGGNFLQRIIRLIVAVLTFRWGAINWGSVAMIFATLFIVEGLLKLVLQLGNQAYYWKEAAKEA